MQQRIDVRTGRVALITGVAGFCGSHLAELLLGCRQRVVGIDAAGAITSNLEPVLDLIELHYVDIREPEQLRWILTEVQPDQIYHLAGRTGKGNKEELTALYEVNLQGTINLLEAATWASLDCQILIAGSSAQYGQVRYDENPIREAQPFRPITHYAVTKATQDMLGYRYWATRGLHVIRARAFNVIGPRQSPQFVASAFAKQIAETETGQRAPILSVGNLEAVRDLIDVRDVVRAYQLLVEQGQPGEAYNVCSGQGHSIRSLLDELLALSTVREIEVRQDSARVQQADVPVQIGDYGKLFRQTGWQPSISLKQSLRDLLDHWRHRVKEGD